MHDPPYVLWLIQEENGPIFEACKLRDRARLGKTCVTIHRPTYQVWILEHSLLIYSEDGLVPGSSTGQQHC